MVECTASLSPTIINKEFSLKTFSDKPVEVDEDITDTQLIENVFLGK